MRPRGQWATYEAETGKRPWRSVERATFVRPSHSKVSNGQVDILLMQGM